MTSGNGQAWSSPSPRRLWRTGKKWRELVARSSVVGANDPRGSGINDDDDDEFSSEVF